MATWKEWKIWNSWNAQASGHFIDHGFANTSSFSDVSAHPAPKDHFSSPTSKCADDGRQGQMSWEEKFEFSDVSLELRSRSSNEWTIYELQFPRIHVHSRAGDGESLSSPITMMKSLWNLTPTFFFDFPKWSLFTLLNALCFGFEPVYLVLAVPNSKRLRQGMNYQCCK